MVRSTDVICRFYSSRMNNICQIRLIFITFKFSHASWIKASITNNTNTKLSSFLQALKIFLPVGNLFLKIYLWNTFVFVLHWHFLDWHFDNLLQNFSISLYFFGNAFCAYLRHYYHLQKSIDSHFLLHKLFFWIGGYLYNPYSFFWMISYDLTVSGAKVLSKYLEYLCEKLQLWYIAFHTRETL